MYLKAECYVRLIWNHFRPLNNVDIYSKIYLAKKTAGGKIPQRMKKKEKQLQLIGSMIYNLGHFAWFLVVPFRVVRSAMMRSGTCWGRSRPSTWIEPFVFTSMLTLSGSFFQTHICGLQINDYNEDDIIHTSPSSITSILLLKMDIYNFYFLFCACVHPHKVMDRADIGNTVSTGSHCHPFFYCIL